MSFLKIFQQLSLPLILLSATAIQLVQSQKEGRSELLAWKPPKMLKKWYPYFVAGYDFDNSPVIVCEFGRWDLRAALDIGGNFAKDFTKYTAQLMARLHESPRLYKHPNGTATPDKWMGIIDLDGFDESKLRHIPTIAKMIQIAGQFANEETYDRRFKKFYLINANYIYLTAYNLLKPALGAVAEDFELFGTISEKWKPVLLRQIPKDQLPEWLGGTENKNYKPVVVFG